MHQAAPSPPSSSTLVMETASLGLKRSTTSAVERPAAPQASDEPGAATHF